jgi:hypothetical protein
MSCRQLNQGGTILSSQNRRLSSIWRRQLYSLSQPSSHFALSPSLSLSLESKNKDELEREDDGGKEEKEKREKWKKQARSALHFLDPWLAQELSHSIFMTISISLNPWLYSSRALSLHFLEINPQTLTNDSLHAWMECEAWWLLHHLKSKFKLIPSSILALMPLSKSTLMYFCEFVHEISWKANSISFAWDQDCSRPHLWSWWPRSL